MAVAATQQNDLQVNIGVGLEKLTRQLAAAEARMVQAARRSEQGFTRANTRIATDFRRVTEATDDLAESAGRLSGGNGLRQVAFQLSQVGQQGAMTGNYLQALSIQMPDLLLAFGTFGALAGTAAAVLTPFAMSLFNSANAADELVQSLTETTANLGSIRSGMDELRDLQEKYAAAIRASADASNTTAAAVAANSKREFEARKQVLAVEVELLRIRGEENREALRNLQDQQRIASENLQAEIGNLSAPVRSRTDAAGFANVGPRTIDEVFGNADASVLEGINQRRLAIQKLNAEIELTTLALDEAGSALSGTFADVGGAGAGGGASGGGGGGGGGGARSSRGTTLDPAFLDAVAQRVTALSTATAQLDQANQAVRSSAEQAFTALITGAKDAQGAAADLLAELAKLAASAAFRSLLGGMGGSPIISAIFGGGPSFAGGGFTGMGARAGGIDGKGGFPAVLHPNERVVDFTKGGGGMAVNVVVNIDAKGAGDSGRGAMGAVDPLKRAVVAAVRDAQRRGY